VYGKNLGDVGDRCVEKILNPDAIRAKIHSTENEMGMRDLLQ
jgi:hypothetical protein